MMWGTRGCSGTGPLPPLPWHWGGTGLEQPPWHLSPPGFSRTVPVSATWPGGSGTKPGGWRRGLRCAGTLPLPAAASCRGPLSSPAEKGPDSVPQRSGEPELSRGSCSVLSVGARCLFLYQQQEYLLSRMENDPSCSVHDPSPSLVLLGLVYPRFCCRVRLFGCRCPIRMSPPCWGGDNSSSISRRGGCTAGILGLGLSCLQVVSSQSTPNLGSEAPVGAEWLRAQGTLALPVLCPHSCSWGWQLPAGAPCSFPHPPPSFPPCWVHPPAASSHWEPQTSRRHLWKQLPARMMPAEPGREGRSHPAPRAGMCQPQPHPH